MMAEHVLIKTIPRKVLSGSHAYLLSQQFMFGILLYAVLEKYTSFSVINISYSEIWNKFMISTNNYKYLRKREKAQKFFLR